MPLQNRVVPDGSIIAHPGRGTLMGNRGGEMHDSARRLTGRRWVSKAWIACVLSYKDRHEVIMAPGHYTQLFFLDEATALAAGHRPCALCRRADFLRFMDAWTQVHKLGNRPRAAEVDKSLHAERIGADKRKVMFAARLADQPDGVMVAWDDKAVQRATPHPVALPRGERQGVGSIMRTTIPSDVALYRYGALYPWTPSGYLRPVHVVADTAVHVLTPRSIVAAIAAGYAPALHASALSISPARST